MNPRYPFFVLALVVLLAGCRMNLDPLVFSYVDPADDSLLPTVEVVALSGRMVDGGLMVTVTHADPITDPGAGIVEIDIDGDATTGFDWASGSASGACNAEVAGVDLVLDVVYAIDIDPAESVWNDGSTYALPLEQPEIVGNAYSLLIPDSVLQDVPRIARRGETRAQAVFGMRGYADCVPGGAPADG